MGEAAISTSNAGRSLLGDRVLLGAVTLSALASLALGFRYVDTTLAAVGAGAFLALAVAAYLGARGTQLSRYVLTLSLVSLVALQIQLGQGRTEYHFGVFVTLAFLLVYLDWRLIVFGAALFAVHHVVFDRLQAAGYGFYCTTKADFPTIVLHAFYVVVQAGVQVMLAIIMRRAAQEGEELGAIVVKVNQTDGIELDLTAVPVSSTGGMALKETVGRMHAVVNSVRANAEGVDVASSEIATGNQDLSARTEQTASNLQSTASSLASLAQAIQGSAQSAATASELAQGASAVASRGGEVVAQVVHTMKGINEASQKIADIIGVIDSIAFQTNILALNAAVEAARAGEQGRGFAVVASEVRSLAGRSAEAAREIKALITASVSQVEAGSELVDQAGSTMTDVVAGIRKVADIVGEINAAVASQRDDVAHVEAAVSEIDHATQQNAALVEQMAAAAASLSTQAQELVREVSVFKRGGRLT